MTTPNTTNPLRDPAIKGRVRDLHVKRIPESAWLRARQNALQSGLSFKAYVTKVLEHSMPLVRESSQDQSATGSALVTTPTAATPH